MQVVNRPEVIKFMFMNGRRGEKERGRLKDEGTKRRRDYVYQESEVKMHEDRRTAGLHNYYDYLYEV